jgi:hypothetical protein
VYEAMELCNKTSTKKSQNSTQAMFNPKVQKTMAMKNCEEEYQLIN